MTYASPHGIEQDRRDFKRDNPDLYEYIALREQSKVLDSAGDAVSGTDDGHAAANGLWARAARLRARYQEMLTK